MRLGIDIGGTKTAALVLDRTGTVVALAEKPSGRGEDATMTVAAEVARSVVRRVGGWDAIDAAGACMPGLVDPRTGWARHAVNLDVRSLDLAGEMQRRLGWRPVVDNDVKAAALGAHHGIRGGGAGTTAYLNVGTGLAAAIVHGGRVLRGPGDAAGEIGHLPVGSGVPCSCGQQGCLETLASGSALARMWGRPAGELFPAAATGDAEAIAAVRTLARGTALAVQVLVLTGAEVVAVGGGVTRSGPALTEAVTADIVARECDSAFLQRLDLTKRFTVLASDVPVEAIGAALLPGALDPGTLASVVAR
ncbi:MAG: ROK family protein [Ornithinibacter sp.]